MPVGHGTVQRCWCPDTSKHVGHEPYLRTAPVEPALHAIQTWQVLADYLLGVLPSQCVYSAELELQLTNDLVKYRT